MLGHRLRRWPVNETLLDICILISKCTWHSEDQAGGEAQYTPPL